MRTCKRHVKEARLLRHRRIKMAARRFRKMHVLGIFHDADDFPVRGHFRIVVGSDFFAERIFVSEEIVRHRFVDDDDFRTRGCVLLGEVAAFHEWNTHSREVAGRNDRGVGAHVFVGAGLVAFHFDALLIPASGNDGAGGQARSAHAGQCANACEEIVVKRLDSRLRITIHGWIERRQENIFFCETGINAAQVAQAVKKQARADQERQRERHL